MKIHASDKRWVVLCIKYFGTAGHPVPSEENLEFFADEYIKLCIRKAGKSSNVSKNIIQQLNYLTR